MSRLLFAAARGARFLNHKGNPVKYVWVWPEIATTDFGIRIHPDDEHLQYGPISSALREAAFRPLDVIPNAGLPYLIGYFEFESYEFLAFESVPELRGTFLLILAEALADEGM